MWIFILLLNYLLSWHIARMAARSWRAARATGGLAVLGCWIGAALAALGFTWCYLILAVLGAHSFGLVVAFWLPEVVDAGTVILAATAVVAVLFLAIDLVRQHVLHGAGFNDVSTQAPSETLRSDDAS